METKDKINEILGKERVCDPHLSVDRERRIAEISFKAGIREVVEEVDRWADETIDVYQSIPPLNEAHRVPIKARIDTLQFTKANLSRLAKEIALDIGDYL